MRLGQRVMQTRRSRRDGDDRGEIHEQFQRGRNPVVFARITL